MRQISLTGTKKKIIRFRECVPYRSIDENSASCWNCLLSTTVKQGIYAALRLSVNLPLYGTQRAHASVCVCVRITSCNINWSKNLNAISSLSSLKWHLLPNCQSFTCVFSLLAATPPSAIIITHEGSQKLPKFDASTRNSSVVRHLSRRTRTRSSGMSNYTMTFAQRYLDIVKKIDLSGYRPISVQLIRLYFEPQTVRRRKLVDRVLLRREPEDIDLCRPTREDADVDELCHN